MNEIILYKEIQEKPHTRKTLIKEDYYNHTERHKLNRYLTRLCKNYKIGRTNIKSRITLFYDINKDYYFFNSNNEVFFCKKIHNISFNKIEVEECFILQNLDWIEIGKKIFYTHEVNCII
jgi:hypothetical protein